ncbi:MAG: response regulator [Nitrospira sp.]|nr:response regulator [Nitrospira sp.]
MMSAGKQVLVADDGLMGSRLTEHLSTSQVTVVTVTDGLQALRALHNRHFDAVITDQQLPYFDGLDLLGQCHLVWPELPVIILSFRLFEVMGPARAKGAYACLLKPVDTETLLYVLSEAMACSLATLEATRMT